VRCANYRVGSCQAIGAQKKLLAAKTLPRKAAIKN
jgi:hypothetical protein